MAQVDYANVLEELDELGELLDVAEEQAPAGAGFFADVREKAASMRDWIETNEVATDKQAKAVENWADAVRKWIRE